MFAIIMWIGTGIGLICGLAHGISIWQAQKSLPGENAASMAGYRALWAVVLWTLAGGYLLIMWLIGLALKPILGTLSRRL